MTLRSEPLGPPRRSSGAARWFGRNFLEALIWALAGATILLVLMAIYAHPLAVLWTSLTIVAVGGLGLILALRSLDKNVLLNLTVFGLTLTIGVTPGGPQRDQR